jgi:hypothetical protein
MSFLSNLRKSDLRSNFIEVGLDNRGNSTIVRIETPLGDILHTFDPSTHIAKTYSQLGTNQPACVIRYNVRELKWNGNVKQKDCVPRCCID